MSDTRPIDTDEVQSLAQDAMEKRPWPHVDAVLYPDNPQHTADELRNESDRYDNMASENDACDRAEAAAKCERTASMLRAGADAMEDLKIAIQAGTEVEGELAKAEARVKVLEEALRVLYEETADYIKINQLGDVHHNQSMKLARAALQVKP